MTGSNAKYASAAVAFLLILSMPACGSYANNTDTKVSGIPDPKEIEISSEEPSLETPSPEEPTGETLPVSEAEPAGSYESSLYVAEVQEDREIPTSYWVTFYDDYTGSFLRSIDGYVREELEKYDFTWDINDSGAPTAYKNGGGDERFSPSGDGLLMEDRGILLTRSSAKIKSRVGKDAETAKDEASSLSPELQKIENDLQSTKYNGFLTEEYTKPEDIRWTEVFYVGAGLLMDDDKLSKINNELMQAYMKETGTDESEFQDFSFDVYEGQVIRDFVKGTSGFSVDEVADKLGLTYSEKWDVFAGTGSGDTNMVGIKVLSGDKDDDGVYTVRYENYGQPFKLRLKENGDYWQFFSNEWDPADGRTSAINSYYNEAIEEFEKEHDTGDLGYWLHDIDGDGTVELFLGKVREGDRDGSIDRLYYIRMGQLSECPEVKGDDLNRFYIAGDDTLYEAKVDDSGKKRIMHYDVSGLGSVIMLFPIDMVLYDKNGKNGEENPWYYGKGNGYIKEKISEKEFEDYRINAGKAFRNPEYVPLSEWVR